MSYTLIGSLPSPFVRRIRMVMEHIPHEFKPLNIYEPHDAEELKKHTPINQIPVLLDGETKIWDSRVIFNYLSEKHEIQKLSWPEENLLTAIEGALNAGVALLLMKRSGIDTNQPYMIVERHKERIDSILNYLKSYAENEGLIHWNFVSISLYSFLDWGVFREIIDLSERPEYLNFLATHCERAIVKGTEIPRG